MAYTTINKSGDYFNTKLYTGGSGDTAHTGVGFQPDLVWIKERTRTRNHAWFDVIRGSRYWIGSNSTDAQDYNTGAYLVSFDSDGFTTTDSDVVGKNGYTYASWNWKANGAGSANTDGSISSTVSANTTSGFSIVKWTPTNTNTPQTIGHGLGVAPSMIIVKNIQRAVDWKVYHKSIGNTHALTLNGTNAKHDDTGYWEDTTPTSTVFTTGNGSGYTVGAVTENFIAYCFAEKTGYSKFGSYTGNGNADGVFVYTGFKPAYVTIKRTNATSDWHHFDNKRGDPVNNGGWDYLKLNDSGVEGTASGRVDFLSNGFKLRYATGNLNEDGDSFIYNSFAEAPLVGTNGVTAKAR